ncbi:MAG: hypothetical protein WBY53_18920, partial [Acidobacteriaceae bacterium]
MILSALLLAITLPLMKTPPQTPATTPTPTEVSANLIASWQGTLQTNAIKLRVVFHITSTPTGLSSTFDSLDQGTTGIATTSTHLDGHTLTIEATPYRFSFTATLSPDANTLTGTFTQNGTAIPLTLTRVTNAAELAPPPRPQNPVPPFPYQSLDVTYPNPLAGLTLAATLTLPTGAGPFPAVVLIPGSGPHDRDETLFGHKPFLVLS